MRYRVNASRFFDKVYIIRKYNGSLRGSIHMAIGFVLISAAPAHEHEVYNKLSKIPEIIELHPLFGEYDLIAKIEAEDFEKLGEIVVNKIRTIEGVIDTKTLTGTKF
jgi:DNA-binding Lrp family transcriptional regulator